MNTNTPIQPYAVLVVESNPLIAEIIVHILRAVDIEPYVVQEGRAALDILAQYQPDLVLLDLNLPDMDGWDVLTDARERYGDWGTRVILTTAYDDGDTSVEGRLHGVVDYLSQMVGRAKVHRAAKEALRLYAAHA